MQHFDRPVKYQDLFIAKTGGAPRFFPETFIGEIVLGFARHRGGTMSGNAALPVALLVARGFGLVVILLFCTSST